LPDLFFLMFVLRLLRMLFGTIKMQQACLRFPACISLKFLRLQISKADFPFLAEMKIKCILVKLLAIRSAALRENVIMTNLTCRHTLPCTRTNNMQTLGQREGKASAASAMTASEKRLSEPCLCIKHYAETRGHILKHVASFRE
jgi:hypothetical protein